MNNSLSQWPHRTLELRPPLALAEALSQLEGCELDRLARAVATEQVRRLPSHRLKPSGLFRTATRALMGLALVLPLVGCAGSVKDPVSLYQYLTKATVEYADPTAFQCEPAAIPYGKGLDTCAKCQNVTGTVQPVTLEGKATFVVPRASVMSCQHRAFVLPPTAAENPPATVRR